MINKPTDDSELNNSKGSQWIPITSQAPPRNCKFEVLNFGHGDPAFQLIQTGRYNEYGVMGIENEEGEHCKPSTITHWRYFLFPENGEHRHD